MFVESVRVDLKETLKRRERVSRALASLKVQDSIYAQEHRDLLAYLDDVLATQNDAIKNNSRKDG